MSIVNIRPAQSCQDLEEAISIVLASQHLPYIRSVGVELAVPPEQSTNTVKVLAARLWTDYSATHGTHFWWLATEIGTGAVIGTALLEIYGPEAPPKTTVDWMRPGPLLPFYEEMLRQLSHRRVTYMHGRNIGIRHLHVHPNHDCKAVARFMVESANIFADEQKLPIFVELTREGKQLFRQLGYVFDVDVEFRIDAGSPDIWKRAATELVLAPWSTMARPFSIWQPRLLTNVDHVSDPLYLSIE